jgi:hypothetical protein
LKRQQLDEERYSSIERANYLLLERMSHIMTHPQTVDMKQALPPPKSLNKDGRKKELMRITEENHNILRRIQVRFRVVRGLGQALGFKEGFWGRV